MVELTAEQHAAMMTAPERPLQLVDPATQRAFVLLPADEYQRLVSERYDASSWTDEEMALLALEDADRLGWEGMEPYQDPGT